MARELYTCANLILQNNQKDSDTVGSETIVTFEQTKQLLEMMGYLTRSFGILPKQKEKLQHETDLLQQMWLVLLEANYSNRHSTLGAIKRFLYVIEGLDK